MSGLIRFLLAIRQFALFLPLAVFCQAPLDSAPVRMVAIPPGSFLMGSPSGEPGRWLEEGPQQSVTLTRLFLILDTPVTWELWNRVRDWAVGNGYPDLAPGRRGSHGDARNTDRDPVTMVSWFDAVKWLNAWSEMEGLTPCYRVDGVPLRAGLSHPQFDAAADGYRLPTEAEWEYAARSGTRTAFPSGPIRNAGDCLLDPETAPNLDRIGWYSGNSGGRSHPVALKEPNGFGLYDMAGNVWEWVWDWFGFYGDAAATDPTGPEVGPFRVMRGGSWLHPARHARSASRISEVPFLGSSYWGFRAARNAPPENTNALPVLREPLLIP